MSLTVRAAAPNGALTGLLTVKQTMGLDLADECPDPVLNGMIARASSAIESFTGRRFAREAVTETLAGTGAAHLLLGRFPICRVAEVRFNGATVAATGYGIQDRRAGILNRADLWDMAERSEGAIAASVVAGEAPLSWAVDYTAGYVLPGWPALSLRIAPGDVDPATDRIARTGHGLIDGDEVDLKAQVALPGGLSAGSVYHVVGAGPDDFQLAMIADGPAVDLTDAGAGDFIVARRVTLPPVIEQAAIETVRSFYDGRARDPRIASERIGDYAATYFGNRQDRAVTGLPSTVEAMLEPERAIF